MDKKKIFSIIAVIVIVVGGLYIAVKNIASSGKAEETGPIYATRDVVEGNIKVGVETKGQLQPTYGGGIRVPGGYSYNTPSIQYTVDEILVEEGDAVTEGQLLVKLVSDSLESDIEKKKDEIENIREALSDMTGVDESAVESINPYSGVVLRAPISGRVTQLNIESGDLMGSGDDRKTQIATIIDDTKFKVRGMVTQSELSKVKKDDELILSFDDFDGNFKGTVTKVNQNPTPNEGSDGFVYWVEVVGENPGLVQEKMKVKMGIPAANDPNSIFYFSNTAEVEKFMEQEKMIYTKNALVTDVDVYDYQMVQEGDAIITLSGDELQDELKDKLDELRELKSDIKSLEKQFDNMEIRSGMNGVISYIEVEEGDSTSSGRWIGDIYNTGEMNLWTQVDDIDIINVRQDAPVIVTVDAVPGETFEGTVTNISTRGNNSGGVTKFDVYIEVLGGAGLRPGMQAKAYIDAGSAENVLLIPIEALFDENGEEYVEILEEGQPKMVQVELGLMNDRYAEVTTGVAIGQKVITGSSADMLPSEHITADEALIPSDDKGDDNGDDNSGDNADE